MVLPEPVSPARLSVSPCTISPNRVLVYSD